MRDCVPARGGLGTYQGDRFTELDQGRQFFFFLGPQRPVCVSVHRDPQALVSNSVRHEICAIIT